MIVFLAEIADRHDEILPTPSNERHSSATSNLGMRGIVYEIDMSEPPTESYWLGWGGHFNHFRGTQIMVRYGDYLSVASSMDDMRGTLNSLFILGRTVFIHIPKHPWLFPSESTSFENVIPFLSSALDPANPSNNILRETRADVRLEVPDFTVKLSDNIAGVTLNQGFSITLKNEDGKFDDESMMNIFNTPLFLKKSAVENPNYEDFKMIRNGLVENKSTSFGSARISAADRFKALGEPACEAVGHPAGINVRDDALNRPIPIVFGTARVRLTRLDDTRYMAAENAASVVRVFDRNGNAIGGASLSDGIITLPGGAAEAAEAIIMGNSDNRIGQVIRWLLENRAGVPFNATNFNMTEYSAYANGSFRVNYAITGGTIRGAIEEALRSDMAFFVQQTDGRFTLRSYQRRGTYPLHEIPSWATTKKPEKDFGRAQDNYFSSCVIEWTNDDGETISELYDGRASGAERRYRRRVQKTFATNLTNAGSARELAGVLSDRYSSMRQVIKLSVGTNTAPFELLDRVRVDLTVNDRRFSRSSNFIVTGVNHSQDTLTLEEID